MGLTKDKHSWTGGRSTISFQELFCLNMHEFFVLLYKTRESWHFQTYKLKCQIPVWRSEIRWPLEFHNAVFIYLKEVCTSTFTRSTFLYFFQEKIASFLYRLLPWVWLLLSVAPSIQKYCISCILTVNRKDEFLNNYYIKLVLSSFFRMDGRHFSNDW